MLGQMQKKVPRKKICPLGNYYSVKTVLDWKNEVKRLNDQKFKNCLDHPSAFPNFLDMFKCLKKTYIILNSFRNTKAK